MEQKTQEGRRARNKALARQRILEAARTIFIADGINDADLVQIAERAEVGRATLYRYFESKDALLTALMDEDWDKQAAIFQRLVDTPGIDLEVVRKWLGRLLRATAARIDSFHFSYAAGKDPLTSGRLMNQRERLMKILGQRFENFGSAEPSKRVAGLLLLFQIEQYVTHAAVTADEEQDAFATDLIARQLMAQLLPSKAV